MTTGLRYRIDYFPIVIGLLLIMLAASGIFAPTSSVLKGPIKQISIALTESDEKQAETYSSIDKTKVFYNSDSNNLNHLPSCIIIVLFAFHHISYKTSHYLKVTIPPPDSVDH